MIRRLEIQELEITFSLILDVISGMNAQGIDQWDAVYPNEAKIRSDIENAEAFGYFEKENLIGYMVLNETFSPEYLTVNWRNKGRALIVHRLCVAKKFQGKGIAGSMMKYAEEFACSRSYESIHLDAFVSNPAANALYQKSGYNMVGQVQFRKGFFYCYEKEL